MPAPSASWRTRRRCWKLPVGRAEKEAAQLDIEHFWAGALRRAVIDGDVENGSLMAGQCVGMVAAKQPAAEIIAELIGQAGRGRWPGARRWPPREAGGPGGDPVLPGR